MIKPGPHNAKALRSVKNIKRIFDKGIHNALYEVGAENLRYMKSLLDQEKSGRTYIFQGEEHIASAPGEPPANRSGILKSSMDYQVHGTDRLEFGDKTIPGRAPVGSYLELGTENIEARSHIEKTARDRQQEVYTALGANVKQELYSRR